MILRTIPMFIIYLSFSVSLMGQSGFHFLGSKKKDCIAFELVNNLPIVKVEVNGTMLSFILDTGVKSSILFSLEDSDSVRFRNTSAVRLNGLGAGGSVEALRSLGNTVKVGKTIDENHSIYIIFDSSLNFSPRMGVPIHGILGNDFFQNFVVKINYSKEKITVYDSKRYFLKKCRKCEDLALEFDGDKPYIKLLTSSENSLNEVTLLVDSGSSDVMWLFDEGDFIKDNPKNYIHDFLGLGLGGDIFGKRAQIPELLVGNMHLKKVITSFPEEKAIAQARYYDERDGSVGGGFLGHFTVIFDYKRKLIRFKKNSNFDKPFNYDMSGLTIEHKGMELTKSEKPGKVNVEQDPPFESSKRKINSMATEFQFSLIPRYVVVGVREGSAAKIAGVEVGDQIMSINGKPNYRYKLYQLIDLFSSQEGKKISMEIERNGVNSKVKFELKSAF